ncbi:hypothetical protein [Streptomyces sp. IBSBF 3010]|uniref:hypothetical protein n=1 Tax=Streptomyces sp. IBSBF 3010 TaxID=2903526 RepID=UPI002FDBEBC8
MAQIGLEIHTDDPAEAAAFEAYWRLADDGATWAQTVAEVRAEHALKPQELSRIVQTCGSASILDMPCTDCGEVTQAAHRTEFASLTRQGQATCETCQLLAHQELEEAKRQLEKQRREALLEHFPVRTTETLDAGSLTLFQAVALHAMFSDPAVEEAGMTTPTGIWPNERPWAPDNRLWDFERRLLNADYRTVAVHPDSHPNSFVWEDNEPNGSYYLGKASYYLYGPEGHLNARAPHLLNDLNRIFREGPWPAHWHNQWRDLWEELALSYASTYLDMKLNEHHLEMKQGDGTLAALSDALATFSLGQVFNFIYRATKDSAAYFQRGGVNRRQAANSTVGRISAAADRARANGWEIKPFGRPWSLPLTAIGETFFSKVMWQADMMPIAARDATPPPHAAAPVTGIPEQVRQMVGEEADERPAEPSDDDIHDCDDCGRQFYGTGICKQCAAL